MNQGGRASRRRRGCAEASRRETVLSGRKMPNCFQTLLPPTDWPQEHGVREGLRAWSATGLSARLRS